MILVVHSVIFVQTIEKIAPEVWKVSFGTPEKFKPSEFKDAPALDALKLLPDNENHRLTFLKLNSKPPKRLCCRVDYGRIGENIWVWVTK